VHLKAECAQALLDAAAQLLPVLQGAGRVVGQLGRGRAVAGTWASLRCSAGTRSGSSSLKSRAKALTRCALAA